MVVAISSKDGVQLINWDNVINLFAKAGTVKVNYINGSGSQIAQYNSQTDAQAALSILGNQVRAGSVVWTLPSDDEVKAYESAKSDGRANVHHYVDGKKTKGHGGS